MVPVAILFLLPLLASSVVAQCVPSAVPFPGNCEVLTDGPGHLYIVPDGSGPGFESVGATITLVLRDEAGFPVTGFPREDMWLEADQGNLTACSEGTAPDDCTDDEGTARWHSSPRAGGSAPAPLKVMVVIDGEPVQIGGDVPVSLVSTDINGDLVVDLCDLGLFATDWNAGYDVRSDMNGDGVLSITDIAFFQPALCAGCPESGAPAVPPQTSGSIGLYFDTMGVENSLFTDPLLPFTFHVLAVGVPHALRGWAFSLEPDPRVHIVSVEFPAGFTGFSIPGTAVGLEGVCLPQSDVVLLASFTGILVEPGEYVSIGLTPASSCAAPSESVSLLTCEGPCDWVSLDQSALTGALLNPTPVSASSMSFSEIKSLW